MRVARIELKKPIWGGGTPKLGVADFRIKGVDMVEVVITYERKDGRKSYPGVYRMDPAKLVNYPTQVVGSGVRLFVAPMSDWEHSDE